MYHSLNSAIYDLRKRGYRLNFFHHQFDYVTCLAVEDKIPFSDIKVDESYSFITQPENGGQSTLYAIRIANGLRGILFEYAEDFKLYEKSRKEKSMSNWVETY